MNISYNWLNDLIDIDLAPNELGEKLTNIGLAVEGIHAHGDDFVFDIDLTSNRPDCLSHLGVAREIGVISNKASAAETQRRGENGTVAPNSVVLTADIVKIEAADLCARFTARIIKNVKIATSPQWLARRLEAIGERSINNVADITNYVMHELGQPMHAFDLDKLNGKRIVVRRANAGETITTLDEIERNLDSSTLAICDTEKPIAVAGVMGGLDSSITDDTSNVLLEVAFFKRENIRATSRKLNLSTEASYRFERGVDVENLVRASNRATELICELAGGTADELIDVYPTNFKANNIRSNDISAAVKRLTGLDVSTAESIRVLTALGLTMKAESEISDIRSQIYVVPSWRHDLAIEEDLVEEVARHAGYENIASELPPAFGAGEYQATEIREKLLRQTLVVMGFDEALSFSFIDKKFDGLFETAPGLIDENTADKYVTLQDSVVEGAVRMRPSLLPGLLDAVRLNFNHQRRDLRLFELGKVFAAKSSEDNLPNEQESFGMVITGSEIQENRAMPARQFDFYDAKGAVEAALDAAGATDAEFTATNVKHLRIGQSAAITVGGKAAGYVGRLSDEIAATYKFKQPVYLAEINLQLVLDGPVASSAYRPLAKYPSVVRDVSFIAHRKTAYADISGAILEQNYELCTNVMFVDIYEGKGLTGDERSITIRLEYRSDERTLVEDEVESLHRQIVEQIENKLDIKVRF